MWKITFESLNNMKTNLSWIMSRAFTINSLSTSYIYSWSFSSMSILFSFTTLDLWKYHWVLYDTTQLFKTLFPYKTWTHNIHVNGPTHKPLGYKPFSSERLFTLLWFWFWKIIPKQSCWRNIIKYCFQCMEDYDGVFKSLIFRWLHLNICF